MSDGSWVTWVMGQFTDVSDRLWVTNVIHSLSALHGTLPGLPSPNSNPWLYPQHLKPLTHDHDGGCHLAVVLTAVVTVVTMARNDGPSSRVVCQVLYSFHCQCAED